MNGINLGADNGYSKKVVEKFENTLNEPKKFNVGRFNPSDLDVGTGMVGAPACGDVMKLQIKCEPKGNSHVIKMLNLKLMVVALRLHHQVS